jgi:hypothetical protein
MIYKTLHRKIKIQQYELHIKSRWTALEGYAVSTPLLTNQAIVHERRTDDKSASTTCTDIIVALAGKGIFSSTQMFVYLFKLQVYWLL